VPGLQVEPLQSVLRPELLLLELLRLVLVEWAH
jgi:hypothetical protein